MTAAFHKELFSTMLHTINYKGSTLQLAGWLDSICMLHDQQFQVHAVNHLATGPEVNHYDSF